MKPCLDIMEKLSELLPEETFSKCVSYYCRFIIGF